MLRCVRAPRAYVLPRTLSTMRDPRFHNMECKFPSCRVYVAKLRETLKCPGGKDSNTTKTYAMIE